MDLRPDLSGPSHVVIDSGGKRVAIFSITRAESERRLWVARWEIRQSRIETIDGAVVMGERTLEGAFGIRDYTPLGSMWMLSEYQATNAEDGKFIRNGRLLNISGPGTPRQGKPNISLELSSDIKASVQNLLAAP